MLNHFERRETVHGEALFPATIQLQLKLAKMIESLLVAEAKRHAGLSQVTRTVYGDHSSRRTEFFWLKGSRLWSTPQ